MPAVKHGRHNGWKDHETESHAKPYIVTCAVKFFQSEHICDGIIEG